MRKRSSRLWDSCTRQLGLESQLLCAQKLEFIHPVTGEPLRLESEYGI